MRTEPTELNRKDGRERRREIVDLLATAIANSQRTRVNSEKVREDSDDARLNSSETNGSL